MENTISTEKNYFGNERKKLKIVILVTKESLLKMVQEDQDILTVGQSNFHEVTISKAIPQTVWDLIGPDFKVIIVNFDSLLQISNLVKRRCEAKDCQAKILNIQEADDSINEIFTKIKTMLLAELS